MKIKQYISRLLYKLEHTVIICNVKDITKESSRENSRNGELYRFFTRLFQNKCNFFGLQNTVCFDLSRIDWHSLNYRGYN